MRNRQDLTVWVVAVSSSGALAVCRSRKDAEDQLRAWRERFRAAIFMHDFAVEEGIKEGKKGRMPKGWKIVKMVLPGAGYDALYPRTKD